MVLSTLKSINATGNLNIHDLGFMIKVVLTEASGFHLYIMWDHPLYDFTLLKEHKLLQKECSYTNSML